MKLYHKCEALSDDVQNAKTKQKKKKQQKTNKQTNKQQNKTKKKKNKKKKKKTKKNPNSVLPTCGIMALLVYFENRHFMHTVVSAM